MLTNIAVSLKGGNMADPKPVLYARYREIEGAERLDVLLRARQQSVRLRHGPQEEVAFDDLLLRVIAVMGRCGWRMMSPTDGFSSDLSIEIWFELVLPDIVQLEVQIEALIEEFRSAGLLLEEEASA